MCFYGYSPLSGGLRFWSWHLRQRFYFAWIVYVLAAWAYQPVAAQQLPQAQIQTTAPEAASGRAVHILGLASHDMVASANPVASSVGRDILRQGGNDIDALIATQMVLNLVEPQSSGIGGGAFLVLWDAKSQMLTTLDGRETAPASATPERFLDAQGEPLPFYTAVVSGRSVGVPGTLRVLERAHQAWGKLPWAKLFEPAIALAEHGFAISPRLNSLIEQDKFLRDNPRARAYFYEPDGRAKAVGTILKNPAFAETLRQIADHGASVFYSGSIAADIVATIAGHPTRPGDMTLADLSGYQAIERAPVCGIYHLYRVCSMAPPSSGGIAVLQMLAMLEPQPLATLGEGPEAAHLFAEAGSLAFADRALYVADPDFIDVPTSGLLDRFYLQGRGDLISPDHAMGTAKAGEPPRKKAGGFAPSDGIEHGTSHISIVDADGNGLSMTTTIEDAFGARLMTAGGFLLNNELTDFNFSPQEQGRPVANSVQANKRPRSSMSPTLVFDAQGQLYAALGSAGGSQIINFVAKTLVALLDWHVDPQQAVDMANFGSRNGPTELEAGSEAEGWSAALKAKGHDLRFGDMTSGTQAIVVTPQGLQGGADSRREGVALGD